MLARVFPTSSLQAIEEAIRTSERSHSAELRFVIEAALEVSAVLEGVSPRQRALELFAHLAVWDTHANNGVLLYVMLADRAIEIVADRGFSTKVESAEWDEICAAGEAAFRAGRLQEGALLLVERVSELAARHFPCTPGNLNELADAPLIL